MKKSLKEMARKNLPDEKFEEFLAPLDELFDYHDQRIVKLDSFNQELLGEFNYDFIKWEKDFYRQPLVNYKSADTGKVKIKFTTNIPGQFDTFIKKVEEVKRPFSWHNYLYPSNIKTYCKHC